MLKRSPLVREIKGQVFGRLTVLEFAGRNSQRLALWRCRCECGTVVVVNGRNLRSRVTVSCGCRRRETLALNRSRSGGRTHGLAGTPEHRAWAAMLSRCYCQSHISFPRYGGRGIRVCDRWRRSFEAFLADLGPKPSAAHSLDRIDPNADYSPENCRWADKQTQARNKRNNRLIRCMGRTATLSEWSDITGLRRETIAQRLVRGWDVQRALTAGVSR